MGQSNHTTGFLAQTFAIRCRPLTLKVRGSILASYIVIAPFVCVQWEKLRLEAEVAALKECTFAPKAVANNRRHLAGYVPIQDRLGELQRRKR